MARLFGGEVTDGPKATFATELDCSDFTDCTIVQFVRTPSSDPIRGYLFADMISDTNARFFLEFGNQGGTPHRIRAFTNYSSTSCQLSSTNPSISIDTWYMLAAVRTGSPGTASNWAFKKATVGGSVTTLGTTGATNSSGTIAAAATETVLGNRGATGASQSRTLHGQIAYPRVYSEALSDADLAQIANGNFTKVDTLEFAPDFTQAGDGDDDIIPATVVFEGTPTPSAQADPTFTNDSLVTADLAGAAPVLDTPTLTENGGADHVLTAADLAGATPTLDTPTLSQTYEVLSDFPTSNLDVSRTVISGAATATPTFTIYAEPGTNISPSTPTNIYYGFSFRVDGVNGKTPTFVLAEDDPFRVNSPADSSYRPWFTYDDLASLTATWTRFANNTVSGGDLSFSHSGAFSSDTVYIGHRPQYPTAKARAFVDSIKANAYVSMPPSSSGADHVYFTTTATTKVDGSVQPSVDLLSVRITDSTASPDDGSDKIHVTVTAGQHAGEVQAMWALQNYIEDLLSASADGVFARKHMIHDFYFIINSTGRDGGAYRGTLQSGQEAVDTNRVWDDTPPALEEINATKNAISTDSSNAFHVLFDFHGRGELAPAVFGHTGTRDDNYIANIQAIMPSVLDVTSGEDSGIITVWARATTGVLLATTLEGDGIVSDIAEYETFGEAALGALVDSYQAGDFINSLAVAGLTGVAPTLDTPSFSQVHVLSEMDFLGGTPNLDTPTLGNGNEDVLTAADLTGSAPVLDTPVMAQTHSLQALGIQSTITLSSPILLTSDQLIRMGQIGKSMRRHLEITWGESMTFNGVIRTPSGERINIANDTLTWKIGTQDRRRTLVTLTEGDGITKTDATRGEYTVTLNGTKVADIAPGFYSHQGEGVFGTLPYGYVAGRIEIRRDLP